MPSQTPEELRRDNLRRLIAERGGANVLAKALGYSNASFLSQMCGPSPMREVSEKTARKFEKKLGLPAGHLDRDATSDTANNVVDVVRLVGKLLDEESVSLPAVRFSDLVALALTDAQEHGGQARGEHIRAVVRLLK